MIFILALIVGVIIFQQILKTNIWTATSNNRNSELIIKEMKLIGDFNKQLQQNIDLGPDKTNQGLQVEIIQWYISVTGDYIEASNNLVKYKWYILPRFFYFYKTLPLEDIAYFSQDDYETKELDYFIQNILVAKTETTQKQSANVQLPVKWTIIENFDLGCMFQNKLYQDICDKHITEFLNVFFVYKLSNDYPWLETAFNTIIKKEQYNKLLCESMDKYIMYSNDTNATIEGLVRKCGTGSIEKFRKVTAFIEIQEELNNKQISKSVYNDNDINAYKLLSIQQMVYKDIINNRANTDSILQYLNFLKELLIIKKIDTFYKDMSYRFNNKYIHTRIENPNNPISKNRKYEADEIIKQITVINNGSELLGLQGLIYQIKNQKLLPSPIAIEIQTKNSEDSISTLLNQFSYLKIKEKIFSGGNIVINGDLIINDPKGYEQKLKLNVMLLLHYQENKFIVKKITIEGQTALNTVIKEILSKKEYSLGEMKEYIEQNFAFYDKAAQTDVWDLLCNQIKKKIIDIEVDMCTSSSITAKKTFQNKIITYEITFENYKIKKLVISDPKIQTIIDTKLENISTNEVNFADIIGGIINYSEPLTQATAAAWASNMIIITEKVKNYLGINIIDIAEKNGKILIEFDIWNINFIGNYNVTKHIIYPIYFKDILLNKLPAKIINFSLSLDDESKTDIYKFISDPLEYIKTISPESYILYDKFISGK